MLYYYPNRPILVPPDPDNPMNPGSHYITSLENSGKYVAEEKWNGANALIYTDNTSSFRGRLKNSLNYTPTDEVRDELERWPKGCILNVELVHQKTTTVKNLIIVHCVMAWKGRYLIGKTWGDSRRILEDQRCYGRYVKLSKVCTSGFWDLFQRADGKIIEGIVLKDPRGKLIFSTTPVSDVPWMLKIRKPNKKYAF
jgi:hypothetical protein